MPSDRPSSAMTATAAPPVRRRRFVSSPRTCPIRIKPPLKVNDTPGRRQTSSSTASPWPTTRTAEAAAVSTGIRTSRSVTTPEPESRMGRTPCLFARTTVSAIPPTVNSPVVSLTDTPVRSRPTTLTFARSTAVFFGRSMPNSVSRPFPAAFSRPVSWPETVPWTAARRPVIRSISIPSSPARSVKRGIPGRRTVPGRGAVSSPDNSSSARKSSNPGAVPSVN